MASRRSPRADGEHDQSPEGSRPEPSQFRAGPFSERVDSDPPNQRLDLHEVQLADVVWEEAHLEKANLAGAHLKGANLVKAHLEGVSLYGANLEEASLYKAQLKEASFYVARLKGADLRGAGIVEADLTHAEGLTWAQVQAAERWEMATKLPAALVAKRAEQAG